MLIGLCEHLNELNLSRRMLIPGKSSESGYAGGQLSFGPESAGHSLKFTCTCLTNYPRTKLKAKLVVRVRRKSYRKKVPEYVRPSAINYFSR